MIEGLVGFIKCLKGYNSSEFNLFNKFSTHNL